MSLTIIDFSTVFFLQIMLWKLNLDVVNTSEVSSQRSMENDRNFENILDTSVMIDPRKSQHHKYRPEEYDIME